MDEFDKLGIHEGDEITVSSKYDSVVLSAVSDNAYIPGRIRLREDDMTFLAVGPGDKVMVLGGAHAEAPEEPKPAAVASDAAVSDDADDDYADEDWERVKCIAKTKSGRKCKKWAVQGSEYCRSHGG